jgi:hypothetical protein
MYAHKKSPPSHELSYLGLPKAALVKKSKKIFE